MVFGKFEIHIYIYSGDMVWIRPVWTIFHCIQRMFDLNCFLTDSIYMLFLLLAFYITHPSKETLFGTYSNCFKKFKFLLSGFLSFGFLAFLKICWKIIFCGHSKNDTFSSYSVSSREICRLNYFFVEINHILNSLNFLMIFASPFIANKL